ncbi:GAF domain-containing protein [Mucilaginibacter calamicampi]|uniref:GAF domain-containing protein n=1 Tax=Mucilaginibacter calamicampi TaxID=1302352 RepID=A0ABW2YW88_9SPHI
MLTLFTDKPLRFQFSFHKVIEKLETTAQNSADWRSAHAADLLARVNQHPELRDGITTREQITENEALVAELLADLFPEILTLNEIKAVSLPYQSLIFNKTQRFQNILNEAGPDFAINIRDFDEHQYYVLTCCIILSRFYNVHLDFTKPLFYDIPTADGLVKHYRILYNADFLEVTATEDSPVLTQADIDELIDNYDDLALWKKKFPLNAWAMKGFAIMSLVDVTMESALSNLKEDLLSRQAPGVVKESLQDAFRSMFRLPDLKIGFSRFDQDEGYFNNKAVGLKFESYILGTESDTVLSGEPYQCIMHDQTYFAGSDVEAMIKEYPESRLLKHLHQQGIQSFILAPVIKNETLLGVLELVSPRRHELNSVTANKLDIIMPFLVDSIDRKMQEMQNHVQALIQDHYTTLHPSVYWKFKREAMNFISEGNMGLDYAFKEITFKEVYPFYGQVDISESSLTRNKSVQTDLGNQLKALIAILDAANKPGNTLHIEEVLFDLRTFTDELLLNIRADTEQQIQHYIETKVYPLLRSLPPKKEIDNYFLNADLKTGEFHQERRNYEKTLSLINQKLTTVIDTRQAEIQQFFPHYFERFKTDGIEHNLYMGATIAPKMEFKSEHLKRIRLWQLRVTAEMEIEQFDLKSILPYPLGVTSLILIFSTPIAIRFRMDEKHFDVDGAYNIRYEVIKKRIDKAHIKGSDERITKPGKITIVYSKAEEAREYKKYIKILQAEGILDTTVEHLEVEDLQAVSGLKALRVGVLHDQNLPALRAASYDKLYEQL